jgi:hypothetical protein
VVAAFAIGVEQNEGRAYVGGHEGAAKDSIKVGTPISTPDGHADS